MYYAALIAASIVFNKGAAPGRLGRIVKRVKDARVRKILCDVTMTFAIRS